MTATAIQPPPDAHRDLRVAIFSDSASARFGGEAIHPVHYFRILRSRGIDAWLVVNARTRGEMSELFPNEQNRILYVEDSWAHKVLWQMQRPLPARPWLSTSLWPEPLPPPPPRTDREAAPPSD